MRLTAFALTALTCLASPVAAQGTFLWTYDANFPVFPSEAELNLVAVSPGSTDVTGNGLPRGLIWGRCLSEFDAGEVQLRFETFAGAAQAGDPVQFSISGSNGESFGQTATIENAGDEPVGGPTLIVPNDSPMLTILAESDTVTYGIDGIEISFLEFDLSTNRAYVAEFIDDCAAVGAGGRLQRGGDGAAVTAGLVPGVAPALVPDVGPEISGHVWGRFTQVSPDPFQTVLSLFYAVPETDDVLVTGGCFIGAQGPLISLSAAADIEGLVEGAPAALRFTAADGRSVEVPGTVIGTAAEVGISGVEAVLEPSDPAWLVITGDDTMSIERVGGRDGFTLTGNGPNTIGSFLSDCADIGELPPGAGQAPSAPIGAQPGFLSCEVFGRVSSRDTGTPQVVNFVNATNGFRGLVWIDPTGNPVDVAGLNPGEASAFTTDPGHVWMATDGPGDCLEMIQPVAGQTEYRLTVPN